MTNKMLKSSIKRQRQYSWLFLSPQALTCLRTALTDRLYLKSLLFWSLWIFGMKFGFLNCCIAIFFLLITEFLGVLLNFVAQEVPHSCHPNASPGWSLVFTPSIHRFLRMNQ